MTAAPPPDVGPSGTGIAGGGGRQLYIYYRVPLAHLPQACRAVRAAQAELCAALPGLAAELLQRPLPPHGDATLMETWRADRMPGAAPVLDDALQARIEARMAQALAGLLAGARHVEVFEPCP